MFSRIRSKMIKIEDDGDYITLRGIFGKKIVFKTDLYNCSDAIFSNDYFVEKNKTKKCVLDSLNNTVNTFIGHTYKKVSVQGFCGSGASAVIDLFREFDNTSCLGCYDGATCGINDLKNYYQIEPKWYINLELYKLHTLVDEINEMRVDKRVKNLLKASRIYLRQYQEQNNVSVKIDIVEEFNKMLLSFLEVSIIYLKDEFIQKYELGQMSDNLPITCMEMSDDDYRYEDCYLFYSLKYGIKAMDIQKSVFVFISKILDNTKSNDFLILEQFLACDNGYDLDFHKRYIGNIKQIVVYRDPRDIFINNLYYSTHIDWYSFTMGDFFESSYHGLVSFYNKYQASHPDRLCIRFEELINNYDNTVDVICDFLKINRSHHINKFKHFNPEVSRKNIGLHKKFHNQEIMNQIYKNFKNYCYSV